MANFSEAESTLFDDYFQPLSFHRLGDQLKALELAVIRSAGQFLLSVMTEDIHNERLTEGIEGEPDRVYVVGGDEISFHDLVRLKTCSDDEISPCLVEQND